jgi:hypothetical protein
MRVAAVYNVWSDTDGLLERSIANIRPYVDGIVIVYSDYSNHGIFNPSDIIHLGYDGDIKVFWEPEDILKDDVVSWKMKVASDPMLPMWCERTKRNVGLQAARERGYTHIITMDGDEFYTPSDLLNARNIIEADPSLNGIVVKSQVYFKRPDLTIGLDTTLVPFIHKITPTLTYQMNRKYPYAWVDNVIRIDPTRQFNITSGVMMSKNIIMHHYSYVRKDLEIKIRNSSARGNIENSTIREDWANAKEGYFCKFYGKTLTKCPNLFDLPLDW